MRGRLLYQELARAAVANAKGLLQDARSVHRRGSSGHACALGILAIEEAAKAIIYKQAAEGIVRFVRRKPNNLSTYSEKDLLNHKFKHGSVARLMVGAIEYYPFQQTLASTRKKSFTRAEAERLLHQAYMRQWLHRTELQRGGRATRDLKLMFQTLERLNTLKNGGLYVGRTGNVVNRPDSFVAPELKRVRELANIVVSAADQTVSTVFTPQRRRDLTGQLRTVAAQTRRLQRLAPKQKE
jgi:AbiV family abortive infection protein